MPSYLTPGVYVEEVSEGTRAIERVGTSTAAFLGVAPRADAHLHEAIPVHNWMQFVRLFAPEEGARSTPLSHAVYGFLENGGSRCFVVNVGPGGSIAPGFSGGKRVGIAVLEEVDEVTIVAAPNYADPVSYDILLSHCEKMQDRVAILDSPEDVPSLDALLKVATVEAPRKPKPGGGEPAGGEPPPFGGPGKPRPSSYGVYYLPHLTVLDEFDRTRLVNVPPSGAVAGIYARVDATRGVHKAPANEVVRGAVGLAKTITHHEQGELNLNGINCIRFFPSGGIRVWGARTLDDSGEWKYVNVRRLFNMVKESVGRATQWVVFEPNDQTLWNSLKRDLKAFLTRLWRDGALMGATPEEAFFVKCDAETNPPEVVDAGQVVILIGIAPVKPAEFIIFRIGQHAGGTTVETAGKEKAHG